MAIDLERLRRANARLDAYLAEHPEMQGESSQAEWLEIVKEVIDLKQTYSVQDAAELLGVNAETIRRAIRSGKLKAAQFGGKLYSISRPDLAEFYRQQGGGSLFDDDPDNEAATPPAKQE